MKVNPDSVSPYLVLILWRFSIQLKLQGMAMMMIMMTVMMMRRKRKMKMLKQGKKCHLPKDQARKYINRPKMKGSKIQTFASRSKCNTLMSCMVDIICIFHKLILVSTCLDKLRVLYTSLLKMVTWTVICLSVSTTLKAVNDDVCRWAHGVVSCTQIDKKLAIYVCSSWLILIPLHYLLEPIFCSTSGHFSDGFRSPDLPDQWSVSFVSASTRT